MRNSLAKVNALRSEEASLKEAYYAQMQKLEKERIRAEENFREEFIGLVRANADRDCPLTATQVSNLTDGELSEKSIRMYAVMANYKRHGRTSMCDKPTFPNLQRKRMCRIRHFAELDDCGNIIPNTTKDVESHELVYYME